MNLEMVATSVLVGLIVGWLAGIAVKGGGFGLLRDVMLGVAGSFLRSWIFKALGASPGRVGMEVDDALQRGGGCASGRSPTPSVVTHTSKREVTAQWPTQLSRNFILYPAAS